MKFICKLCKKEEDDPQIDPDNLNVICKSCKKRDGPEANCKMGRNLDRDKHYSVKPTLRLIRKVSRDAKDKLQTKGLENKSPSKQSK